MDRESARRHRSVVVTPVSIKLLQERLEKGTKGEWYTISVGKSSKRFIAIDTDAMGTLAIAEARTGDKSEDDAALIASAVNALPLLLGALKKAQDVYDDDGHGREEWEPFRKAMARLDPEEFASEDDDAD